jgi:hypothetical protein
MPTTDPHRVFTAVLLAASLTTFAVGCGGTPQNGGGPRYDPVNGTPPSTRVEQSPSDGQVLASRVAYFSSSAVTAAGVHEVLRDAGELGGFAQRVASRDPKAAAELTAGGKATDFSREVLVGWTATTGCSAATAATLDMSGERLSLRVSQPDPPPECLRAFSVTVVFAVPKDRIPARPVFG